MFICRLSIIKDQRWFIQPFAIVPKYDCPHLADRVYLLVHPTSYSEGQQPPCSDCQKQEENWACLEENCDFVSHSSRLPKSKSFISLRLDRMFTLPSKTHVESFSNDGSQNLFEYIGSFGVLLCLWQLHRQSQFTRFKSSTFSSNTSINEKKTN